MSNEALVGLYVWGAYLLFYCVLTGVIHAFLKKKNETLWQCYVRVNYGN